jgi:predicted extracellular nuclease
MKKILLVSIMGLLSASLSHAELVQQFKDPTFSGNGWSTQVLTLQQMEKAQKESIQAQKDAQSAAVASAAQNTPMAKFMNLFQSQVYAQLATQLSNNLFQNNCKAADGSSISGCSSPTTGNFTLDGNTVTWQKGVSTVTLTVVDSAGTRTVVTVPIASFAF